MNFADVPLPGERGKITNLTELAYIESPLVTFTDDSLAYVALPGDQMTNVQLPGKIFFF